MKHILLAMLIACHAFAQGTVERVEKRVLVQDTLEGTNAPGVATRRFVFSTGGGQTMEFLSGVNVGPTVTKAPYSAEAVNESIQTLYDGNRIVERSSTKQYRDSEGRERREEGSLQNVVFVSDPIAKISYTLHPESKTAEKMALQLDPGNVFTMNHAPGTTVGVATTFFATTKAGVLSLGAHEPTSKEEDLGTQMIEGVEAKGTRTVTTIPAGEIGNDRPIEIADERWYSPGLQLTVLTRHSDPRMGETTYKLINIQRIEQVRSLFEIPAGYTVNESPIFNKVLKKEE